MKGQGMLDGKVAIVTGASRGIGAGVARELAGQGAQVVLAARTLDPTEIRAWQDRGPKVPGTLAENVASIEAAGGHAEAYKIDLSERDEIKHMVAYVAKTYGRIDILVNCAMGFPNDYKGDVWTSDDTDWQGMMDVGVRSKYLMAHFVSQVMVQQKSGLIANISAGASKDEYYSPMFRMAMAAVDRMTTAIAHDLKPHGVSAVSIWPRWVRTERVVMATQDASLGFDVSKNDLKMSDTPEFTGRGIAHLACDPDLPLRSGCTFPIVHLAHFYGFCDIDGTRPDLDPFTKGWMEKLTAISNILES
jgi:dehydrogenase/reductase SDR family protein 1